MRKYISEFFGTMFLVLFACGAAVVLGCTASADAAYIGTAIAFGLAVIAMAYSIGNISGCHINPAVSLGMLISGRMNAKEFVGYIISQFIGAIVGAAILFYFVGPGSSLGTNGLYNGDVVKSLVIEIVLTFVFVLTVIGVTSKTDNGRVAGIVIGLSLILVHIFGIYFTGTSVNPARSLGPAILVGGAALSQVWVFIVGPFIGGAFAALVYRALDK